jgi:hypothetical protein
VPLHDKEEARPWILSSDLLPHWCWIAGPANARSCRIGSGRAALSKPFQPHFLSTAGLNHLRRGAASHSAGLISSAAAAAAAVSKGRLSTALVAGMFSLNPPGTYGRIKTAATHVEIRPRQDVDNASYRPLSSFIWRRREREFVLNIGNRLNICSINPSADLDISQSNANPESLASPHPKTIHLPVLRSCRARQALEEGGEVFLEMGHDGPALRRFPPSAMYATLENSDLPRGHSLIPATTEEKRQERVWACIHIHYRPFNVTTWRNFRLLPKLHALTQGARRTERTGIPPKKTSSQHPLRFQ